MSVQRFATRDLVGVEFTKNRDTDDDGWLHITFRYAGEKHSVEIGPLPEDEIRGALAYPTLPVVARYKAPRALVMDD